MRRPTALPAHPVFGHFTEDERPAGSAQQFAMGFSRWDAKRAG